MKKVNVRFLVFHVIVGSLLFSCQEEEIAQDSLQPDEPMDVQTTCPPRPGTISREPYTNGSETEVTICSYDLGQSDFWVVPVSGATSYEWKLTPLGGTSSTGILWDSESESTGMNYLYSPPGTYGLDVRAINSCGPGPWSGIMVFVVNCSGGGSSFL